MRRPPRGMPVLAGLVQATQVPPVCRAPEGPAAVPVGGGGARTTHRQQAPPDWIPPRSLARLQDTGLAAVPVGGGGAWPGSETTHRVTRQRPRTTGLERTGGTCRGAGGRRRGLAGLRGAAPNEVRSPSLAGGPPPTGTHSGQAHQGRPRGGRGSGGATSTAGNQVVPQAPAGKVRTPRSTPGSGRPGGRRVARAR